ncbi:hypothetical protein [Nostoc sp.]|uniref:hypothetical protein n=1 Tax=Nostoc sp. TaxID=1180 RepID=UPI002FFC145C
MNQAAIALLYKSRATEPTSSPSELGGVKGKGGRAAILVMRIIIVIIRGYAKFTVKDMVFVSQYS